MSSDWVDRIYLEDDQRQLLAWMVESDNAIPKQQRDSFILVQTQTEDSLIRRGAPGFRVAVSDLTTLVERRLVRMQYGTARNRLYDVTPEGRRYYGEERRRAGETLGVVEGVVRRFLDSERFRSEYGAAYARWRDAADELWEADSEQRYTDIGHRCREAMQLFAEALAQKAGVGEGQVPTDPAKTVDRIRAALRRRVEVGSDARSQLHGALVAYWGAVSDLVQRQEHGALKEGEALVWDDARRVVFYTALVMYELAT